MQEVETIAKRDVWQDAHESDTWYVVVSFALASLGGTATLNTLYGTVELHPKTVDRRHWKAKVRQVLQSHAAFVRVAKGTWSFASEHPAEELDKLRALCCDRGSRAAKPAS